MAATQGKSDYYELLGVPRDADARAIKDAYRKLAFQYHPDRNKDAGAEETFKEITEAYAVLKDPKKRAEYDARGHAGVSGFSAEDLYGDIDLNDLFGGADFSRATGLGLGGDIFERMFGFGRGFGHRPASGPRRGRDIESTIAVPLEAILTGAERTVRLTHPRACPDCHGSGAKPGTEVTSCAACDGTGQRVVREQRGNVAYQQISPCPDCHGHGRKIDTPCPRCTGTGQVTEQETLAVKIPKGLAEGAALRIKGHGEAGGGKDAPAGDLFVRVRTALDPRFERRGADLWRVETVRLTDAVLGTTHEVPTLDGKTVAVRIPPGTQPDTVMRVRGKGLPRLNRDGTGDLFIRVDVSVPRSLSADERALYEKLRDLEK